MDSPRRIAQPWTPPELEDESNPHTNYFDIYGTSPPQYPPENEHRFNKQFRQLELGEPFEDHRSRPNPISTLTEPLPPPHTPIKSFAHDALHYPDAPRYPYTPDSSRILRRNTELPCSPTPWDEYSEDSSSPVQNALSSCIAHFENLLQIRQPDEDQMEYIVGQFEAMAAYLSAPEAQSKTTDDYIFSDHDHGLGITQAGDELMVAKLEPDATYVDKVGNYVAGVQKYIGDLKMRMDEVKTLNSIQLDVINDLRNQMKVVRQGLHTSLRVQDDGETTEDEESQGVADPETGKGEEDEEEAKEIGVESWQTTEDLDPSHEVRAEYSKLLRQTVDTLTSEPPQTPKKRVITIVRRPERPSFWASFGEAVDAVASMLLEE